MGSGLGPSGSTLAAAYREIKFLQALPLLTRFQLREQALLFRWMDDVWQVFPRTLPGQALEALKAMRHKAFYGEQLIQKPTDERVAFGFAFHEDSGQLKVSQNLGFRHDFDLVKAPKPWSLIQGPNSFVSDRAREGVLLGYFLRILDSTNEEPPVVVAHLERLVRELLYVGHRPDILRKVWKKVDRMAATPLPSLDGVLAESSETASVRAQLSDLSHFVTAQCCSALAS
jgi:hypothetical protein